MYWFKMCISFKFQFNMPVNNSLWLWCKWMNVWVHKRRIDEWMNDVLRYFFGKPSCASIAHSILNYINCPSCFKSFLNILVWPCWHLIYIGTNPWHIFPVWLQLPQTYFLTWATNPVNKKSEFMVYIFTTEFSDMHSPQLSVASPIIWRK